LFAFGKIVKRRKQPDDYFCRLDYLEGDAERLKLLFTPSRYQVSQEDDDAAASMQV